MPNASVEGLEPELVNLAADRPGQLKLMQDRLREELVRLQAPPEQRQRLGLD